VAAYLGITACNPDPAAFYGIIGFLWVLSRPAGMAAYQVYYFFQLVFNHREEFLNGEGYMTEIELSEG
jgi:hypothetical protein